jgi:hypothetical protein
MVCACLVTLKPVTAKFFPRMFTPNPSALMPGSREIEEAMGPRARRGAGGARRRIWSDSRRSMRRGV